MTSDPMAVPKPDQAAASASTSRRVNLPPGCLGDLAPIIDTLAGLRRSSEPPIAPRSPQLMVFAGDHGIAGKQLTADLPAATARRAAELAVGTGPTAVLAAQAGVPVDVVDVAIDTDEQIPGVRSAKIRSGSGSIDEQDALTLDEVARAIQLGRDQAAAHIAAGRDLLIGAVCGVGAGTSAAALASYLTGMEPVDATGRGTGVSDEGWIRRVAAVRDARYRLTTGSSDAATLLRVAGGADLAALTGFVMESALHGVPVLVDDIPGAVAAVLAHRFAPGAERYVLVPSPLMETVHVRLLELLGIEPLLTLRLGMGIAVASLLIVPLLRMAGTVVDQAPTTPAVDRAAGAMIAWDAGLL
ncbi:MAG: nicotinate-nucleotide--dimethylbenzimidazole phosphoribosyltransferase [Actinomycetota bacterium]|nr:nicotinate-nucleotide--dimethylbenzimidazole phosphoribosyltransferase [Actinomycetota bacterium]